jgi:hypothetical protein
VADPSLFQTYFNQRKLNAPAFNYDKDKGFIPTENTNKIVDTFRSLTGKGLDIRPANSVMAQGGKPIWGSGGGEAVLGAGIGYVDPLMGNTHVVAHEGAHALMPSPLALFSNKNSTTIGRKPFNPLEIPRESGQRLRYVHETLAKPSMEEEASAQGIAYGVLNKLGIPSNETWQTPIDYPKTYLRQGLGTYLKTEIGPPSPEEQKEIETILNSTDPFLQRVFQKGYNLVK